MEQNIFPIEKLCYHPRKALCKICLDFVSVVHNVLKGEILIACFPRNCLGDLYLSIDPSLNSTHNVNCVVAIISVTYLYQALIGVVILVQRLKTSLLSILPRFAWNGE